MKLQVKKSFNLQNHEDLALIHSNAVTKDAVLNTFKEGTTEMTTVEIVKNIEPVFALTFVLFTCLSSMEERKYFLAMFYTRVALVQARVHSDILKVDADYSEEAAQVPGELLELDFFHDAVLSQKDNVAFDEAMMITRNIIVETLESL